MVDLKKKYSKIYKEKFQGRTVTSNIIDTKSDIQTPFETNYFNRKVKKV